MFALTRILVPTNLGEASKAAIKYGVAFARQFDAKLFLVHVLDAKALDAAIETERVMEKLEPDSTLDAGAEPDPLVVSRNAAREDLGRSLTPQEELDTQAEYLLRPAHAGGAAEAIVECARELDVELIVIGKHRLGLVEQLFAGSVTERVIRQAPCPVLTVHHPEHEFVVEQDSNAVASAASHAQPSAVAARTFET